MGGFEHGFRERARRIQPAAVQADVIFAPLDAVDRQPVDEIGIAHAPDPRQQRDPGGDRLRAPAERGDRAFDSCAGRGVEPVGTIRQHRLQPPPERDHRPVQRIQRGCRAARRLDQRGVRFGQFSLQPIAGVVLRVRARVDQPAHGPEQLLDRAVRIAVREPLQPVVRRERAGGIDDRGDRLAARLVIAARCRTAAPPAPAAVRDFRRRDR